MLSESNETLRGRKKYVIYNFNEYRAIRYKSMGFHVINIFLTTREIKGSIKIIAWKIKLIIVDKLITSRLNGSNMMSSSYRVDISLLVQY